MSLVPLTPFLAIESHLFVRIDDDVDVLRFSDYRQSFSINGESYQGIGNFLGVTSSSSDLRATGNSVTITLSGVPNSSISDVLDRKIKGAAVRVFRVAFNASTGQALAITGNPMGRFRGFINNYAINEDYDIQDRSSTSTISFICASAVDVLSNKVSGRLTNPDSMRRFFPNDASMDRVPALQNTTFDFGAPKK
jgi:cell division protein FtsI/penicillin-binding protein 2